MELGDACISFFFLFNYEVDMAELNKLLGLNVTSLFEKKREINTLSKARKTKETNEKIAELNERFEDSLIELLETVLENKVYFTDKNYENRQLIGVKEFHALFNYNYLNATRLLNDEKTDNYFSISKELLSHFKKSID